MRTIGVTGGIGAGKTEVLQYLRGRWEAYILPLDDVTRSMLNPGECGYAFYRNMWGAHVILEDGSLDKTKIASLLFDNPEKKREIDAFFRPYVMRAVREAKNRAQEEGHPFFIIESAILLEEHYDAFCDELWYIYADESTRSCRLMKARGYSEERIRETMGRQLPEQEFRLRCDFVVDNSGSFEETKKEIDARLHGWVSAIKE